MTLDTKILETSLRQVILLIAIQMEKRNEMDEPKYDEKQQIKEYHFYSTDGAAGQFELDLLLTTKPDPGVSFRIYFDDKLFCEHIADTIAKNPIEQP